ncbi:hypothetical protein M422DRAFT_274105 [Sphaerobolus stellatus SS14]|uniref:Uncharacterized protein n=1 Tax=Sphaerobolus stellatus (strain SS14) TaxID=990650 RepID=A0A0C9UIG5_SPHS4|nr:hypothetical protein M422DRAFT_274105 [Sphaerobolus stellatus SS14]
MASELLLPKNRYFGIFAMLFYVIVTSINVLPNVVRAISFQNNTCRCGSILPRSYLNYAAVKDFTYGILHQWFSRFYWLKLFLFHEHIYIVYDKSKTLLTLLSVLFVAEIVASIVLADTGLPKTASIPQTYIPLWTGCHYTSPTPPHYFTTWIPALLFETLLFGLMLLRGWQIYKNNGLSSLLKSLIVDRCLPPVPLSIEGNTFQMLDWLELPFESANQICPFRIMGGLVAALRWTREGGPYIELINMRFFDSPIAYLAHYVDVHEYGAYLKLIGKLSLAQQSSTGTFAVSFSLFWKVPCPGGEEAAKDIVMLRHSLAAPDVYARPLPVHREMMTNFMNYHIGALWLVA